MSGDYGEVREANASVVMVMIVKKGFGGEVFLKEMMKKIRRLKEMCAERGVNKIVEVR